MRPVSNGVFTKSARLATWMAVAVLLATSAAAPLFAQGRMISVSPTNVQPGQTLRVKSPACAGATTVLVDGKAFPSSLKDGDLELPTTSLAVGSHEVKTDCAGAVSDPQTVVVAAVTQVETPTVVCARNGSPRDGMALPLTSTVQKQESERVTQARNAAKRESQSFPTPEESALLMARCDKDWAWTARLEDSLWLNVAGYAEWIQVPKNEQTPLRLFVDGVEVPSLTVRRATVDKVAKIAGLQTVLTFDADGASAEERAAGRKALAGILRTARSNAWRYGRNDMTVSIGPAGGPEWPTTAKLRINAYPTLLTVLAALGVLTLAVLLLVLAKRTPILRDSGGMTTPFSLAKNQMAMWFVVIFGSFLFITVTTGQAAAMSSTALMLIGISGATGLAAAAMDNRKRTVEGDERRALEDRKAAIQQELDGPGGLRTRRKAAADGSPEAAELDAKIQPKAQELEVVTKKLEETQVARVQTSHGWLTDILSDENGVSFHRVQMLAWTLALIAVFIVAVWRTFAMPDFDATMLLLLGVSSGTYLGFKLPERSAPSGT